MSSTLRWFKAYISSGLGGNCPESEKEGGVGEHVDGELLAELSKMSKIVESVE